MPAGRLPDEWSVRHGAGRFVTYVLGSRPRVGSPATHCSEYGFPVSSPTPNPSSDLPVPGRIRALDPAAARKRGFPGAASPSTAVAPRSGWTVDAPVPQRLVRDRRSGRWLALLILACLLGGAGLMYQHMYGQTVYGLTVGRVVRIPSPWAGTIRSVMVREGDEVREGTPLGVLDNLSIQHEMEHTEDELAIQRATLDAEVAEVKLRSQINGDRYRKALAEFYELWGTYLEESAQMEVLQARLQRLEGLTDKRVVAEESVESLRLELEGQTVKVEKLRVAVQQLRTRAEETKREQGNDEVPLRPIIARIEGLQEQLKRLRAAARQGEIRSNVSGRVVKVHRVAGEHLTEGECLLEILADGTLYPIIYVSDRQTMEITEGQTLRLQVVATGEHFDCKVRRLHDRYEDVPDTLRKFYRFEGRCLPVELEPVDLRHTQDQLRLGGLVRLQPDWDQRWSEGAWGQVVRQAGRMAENVGARFQHWIGRQPATTDAPQDRSVDEIPAGQSNPAGTIPVSRVTTAYHAP